MKQFPKLTAIIADDEPSILKGIHDALQWEDLDITVTALAHDGAQALNLILEHNPDIAILDIKMPQLTGLEVIKKAKEAQSDTDFIILSGYDEFAYAQEAVRQGVRSYLLKPVNTDELYEEICRIGSLRLKQGKALHKNEVDITFFNDLIGNKILDSNDINYRLTVSDINLDAECCYVLVMEFTEDSPETLLQLLSGAFSETRHKFWQYSPSRFVGIFNSGTLAPEEAASRCLRLITKETALVPFIGIGDIVPCLQQCSYSYNRALTALSYRLYGGKQRIFTPQIICNALPHLRPADIDYLPLVQAIVRKNLDDIRSYCTAFMDSLLYVTMPPPNYILSLCSALTSQIERDFTIFSHASLPKVIHNEELYQQRTLEDICQWLIRTFCQLSEVTYSLYGYSCHAEISDDTAEQNDIILAAQEYIQANIYSHIKLEDIAKQVHLSPSYFAIYFKNKTNINLRDYLLMQKMEYARQQLQKPGISVNDIAYDLGYSDYRSFSRAFKNFYGITPSDYQVKPDRKQ